jgi:pyruvate dehydrogenase E1 component
MDHGMRAMMERQEDVFYYLTVMNENYAQPSLPAGVEEHIVRGMYRLESHEPQVPVGRVRLLGSGTILREVIAAAALLRDDWNVASEVFSVTSFSELAREAREVERWNRLHPEVPSRRSHVAELLHGETPIVASTDYVRAYPESIAAHVRAPFVALGTDGFGRSDTRAALRRFFEVDRHSVVVAALEALAREGTIERTRVAEALRKYTIDAERLDPWRA